MSKKERLATLMTEISQVKISDSKISENLISENKKSESRISAEEVNLPYGEKGEFAKVTGTLPMAVYELLMQEVMRRKVKRLPDAQVSAVIRESLVFYLGKGQSDQSETN